MPRQFADSRRSSGVPEVIQEIEENGPGGNREIVCRVGRMSLSGGANIDEFDTRLPLVGDNGNTVAAAERKIDFLSVPIITNEQIVDPLADFRPIEVFERNYYMSRELGLEKKRREHLDVEDENLNGDVKDTEPMQERTKELRFDDVACQLQVPNVEISPKAPNVYSSETITIIDTDVPPVRIVGLI